MMSRTADCMDAQVDEWMNDNVKDIDIKCFCVQRVDTNIHTDTGEYILCRLPSSTILTGEEK